MSIKIKRESTKELVIEGTTFYYKDLPKTKIIRFILANLKNGDLKTLNVGDFSHQDNIDFIIKACKEFITGWKNMVYEDDPSVEVKFEQELLEALDLEVLSEIAEKVIIPHFSSAIKKNVEENEEVKNS